MALPLYLVVLRSMGWVIKDYVKRTVNIASHIPEELKPFEKDFKTKKDYLTIYVPRVIYIGKDEEQKGKTERLLPSFLEPYFRYPVEDIESALDPDEKEVQTTADDRTIGRWRRTWRIMYSEFRRKAEEMKRIGIEITKIPEKAVEAIKEIKAILGERWFSKCYVMSFLTKPSRKTSLAYPLSVTLESLFRSLASNHGGKTDVKSEGSA